MNTPTKRDFLQKHVSQLNSKPMHWEYTYSKSPNKLQDTHLLRKIFKLHLLQLWFQKGLDV